MLVTILNLNGVQELGKNAQKLLIGGCPDKADGCVSSVDTGLCCQVFGGESYCQSGVCTSNGCSWL